MGKREIIKLILQRWNKKIVKLTQKDKFVEVTNNEARKLILPL